MKPKGPWLALAIAFALAVAAPARGGATNLVINSGGSGGGPGGSNGNIQYNNSGVLGGLPVVPLADGGTQVGTPLTFWSDPYSTVSYSQQLANTANELNIYTPLYLNAANGVKFSHICEVIEATDSTGDYDIGIYNLIGNLLVDIGAQHLPNGGNQCFALMTNSGCTGSGAPSACCTGSGAGTCVSPLTLPNGIYVFASTGTATTATFDTNTYNNQGWGYSAPILGTGASSGGVLPATVTPPSLSPVRNDGGQACPTVGLY